MMPSESPRAEDRLLGPQGTAAITTSESVYGALLQTSLSRSDTEPDNTRTLTRRTLYWEILQGELEAHFQLLSLHKSELQMRQRRAERAESQRRDGEFPQEQLTEETGHQQTQIKVLYQLMWREVTRILLPTFSLKRLSVHFVLS